ncbi:MAG: Lrp/AsnC family transcriptional regulator [Rhodoglobus sp.]|uniref:Lrp/AsnC family transcriptional regulator n=2 Tax=Microbacterium TaxID=33882 RepID=A0ABY4IUI8_9MICO|nr:MULTISPECIES: Lrp/AsnC family transcriptional regulator [Microbacterium]MDZ4045774.1 Lrp/AsnC family transcriptional regulator [Rhodoglobus sp.]PKQ35982.1 MAG: Lrp/AsnC family transcriptional regulator [Actinobacteria bacterium HGW-Actinobacteria-11]MCE0510701.1 Lrp/AsnC family transcriptional regulator [Microbacterium sp. KKR3/1]MCK8467902.1 Lrp/AsnC family transcriptional regulator [Microbacterium aurugineum]MCZ4302843.1 Lrp/AsnC family transcriptional regulator [Microbacterium oxydans]
MAKAQLDETDLELLAVLTRDAEITNKALAHRLRLAESTCAHRVRSLRERGVIRDTRIRVDGAALGFPLQAIIKVRLANHTGDKVTALFDALAGVPRVLQVFHVAGVDDFLVHVAVEDATALRDIVLEHITVHPVVRGTETQLVFELRDGPGPLPR